jgi:hypothetical protein
MVLELAQSADRISRRLLGWAVANLVRHVINHDNGK